MDRYFFILCLLSVIAFVKAREGKIIGGDYAAERQFPYQVSVQADLSEQGYESVCGGGIIGERFILTAAHCVIDKQRHIRSLDFKVVVNLTDISDPGKNRLISVEKFHILISFDPIKLIDDIAVLELSQNIGLNNGLRKLDLPRNDENYVGQIAQIAGWGWNSIPVYTVEETGETWEGTGTSDNKLKYTNVNIISNDDCRRKNNNSAIIKSNICGQAVQRYIDGEIEGVCSGDSGGPLVIDNTVIGVVRASPRGCKENVRAAVYTRVSCFIETLNNVMNGRKDNNVFVFDVKKLLRFSNDINREK